MQKVTLCTTCEYLVSTDFCAWFDDRTWGKTRCSVISRAGVETFKRDFVAERVVTWPGGRKRISLVRNQRRRVK